MSYSVGYSSKFSIGVKFPSVTCVYFNLIHLQTREGSNLPGFDHESQSVQGGEVFLSQNINLFLPFPSFHF